MELELRLDTEDDRRFVTDKFANWGYKVIAVQEAGFSRGINVVVEGTDDVGIIDKMCNQAEFDVKCWVSAHGSYALPCVPMLMVTFFGTWRRSPNYGRRGSKTMTYGAGDDDVPDQRQKDEKQRAKNEREQLKKDREAQRNKLRKDRVVQADKS
jgi:hypothetical protein